MSVSKVKGIDTALDEYVRENAGPGTFVTGWVLVTSVSSHDHDVNNQDGYITITSDGLPHHAAVGLLSTSMNDRQNVMMISALHGYFTAAGEFDEEDEEE